MQLDSISVCVKYVCTVLRTDNKQSQDSSLMINACTVVLQRLYRPGVIGLSRALYTCDEWQLFTVTMGVCKTVESI